MGYMFYNCFSLTSLDLNNFCTISAKNFQYMFYNCYLLLSLDLSNFDTTLITNMEKMFYGCSNLKFIDMKNFNEEQSNIKLNNMFYETPDNLVFCIIDETKTTSIYKQLQYKKCLTKDCTGNWKKNIKKIIKENNLCMNNCEDYILKYEYNYECLLECPKNTHPSKDNIYKCEDDIITCPKDFPFIKKVLRMNV